MEEGSAEKAKKFIKKSLIQILKIMIMLKIKIMISLRNH